MAGHKSHRRCKSPVRERNTSIGRNGNGRRHTRNHFKRYIVVNQHFSFLAAAAEDKGIAALEARHNVAVERFFGQKRIDFVLGQRVIATLLACVNETRVRRGVFQKLFVDQIVIDDHLRHFERLYGLERNKPRIPRSRPDDIDFSGFSFFSFQHINSSSFFPPFSKIRSASLLPNTSASAGSPQTLSRT